MVSDDSKGKDPGERKQVTRSEGTERVSEIMTENSIMIKEVIDGTSLVAQ